MELYLGFTVAVYLLNTYLDVRQLRVSNLGLRDSGGRQGHPKPILRVSLESGTLRHWPFHPRASAPRRWRLVHDVWGFHVGRAFSRTCSLPASTGRPPLAPPELQLVQHSPPHLARHAHLLCLCLVPVHQHFRRRSRCSWLQLGRTAPAEALPTVRSLPSYNPPHLRSASTYELHLSRSRLSICPPLAPSTRPPQGPPAAQPAYCAGRAVRRRSVP